MTATPDDRGWSPSAALGGAGLVAMVLAHLVWDPALTLVGVSRFGVAEEDSALVRSLLAVHPGLWLAVKLVVVGGAAVAIHRVGAHRDPLVAVVLWVVAAYGVVAPLGWLELLVRAG